MSIPLSMIHQSKAVKSQKEDGGFCSVTKHEGAVSPLYQRLESLGDKVVLPDDSFSSFAVCAHKNSLLFAIARLDLDIFLICRVRAQNFSSIHYCETRSCKVLL